MAKRHWTCRSCKHGQERTSSRYCSNCGKATKPPLRPPKHRAELAAMTPGELALLSVLIHGGERFACGRCRKPIPADKRRHGDHGHDDGKVRGLLCFQCNTQHVRQATFDETLLTLEYLIRAGQFHARLALTKAAD